MRLVIFRGAFDPMKTDGNRIFEAELLVILHVISRHQGQDTSEQTSSDLRLLQKWAQTVGGLRWGRWALKV